MIGGRLREQVSRAPDAIAVVDGDRRYSYGELFERIAVVRERLRRDLRIGAGDTVILSLPNSPAFIESLFALAQLGAICVPLNHQWRGPELRRVLERLDIAAVVTEDAHRAPWEQLEPPLPTDRLMLVEDLAAASPLSVGAGGLEASNGSFDGDVVYLCTSGSTGKPRLVPRTQRNVLDGARNVARALRVAPGQRFLAVVPFFHANGLSNCLILPLLHGATVVVQRRFAPAPLAELVRREEVDVLIASPFIFGVLAELCRDPQAFSSVETCLSTGAALPIEVAQRCRERLGLPVRQLYGSSETGTIAIEPEHLGSESDAVGAPIEGVEVRVVSAAGEPLHHGEEGEIAVRSGAVMRGYLNEPAPERLEIGDRFVLTGDVGHLDQRGILHVTGRRKSVINVGGMKVDPSEVEGVIRSLTGVRDALVRVVREGQQGETIKVLIEREADHGVSRGQVVDHCRDRLATYKVPRVIEFVETIPRDLLGKRVRG